MQGRKAEMTGFGNRKCSLYSFHIAQLAEQNDIRILAQDMFQRFFEGVRIGTDLALIDQTFFVRMQKLDRIFDGNNMFTAGAVDFIYNRSQSCRRKNVSFTSSPGSNRAFPERGIGRLTPVGLADSLALQGDEQTTS